MSKQGDKLAVHRRDCVRLSPLRVVTASSVPLGCVFGTMAVWTAHLAGAGIVLTAIAGHVGLQRQWIAAAVAPAAIAACLAAPPCCWPRMPSTVRRQPWPRNCWRRSRSVPPRE
jgi:hypothetical protein